MPHTWADGEQVTKGQFVDWNNSMVDAGDHTGWSTWAPVLGPTWSVGTDGTAKGWMLKVGQLALVSFDLTHGTTANGAGGPVTAGPSTGIGYLTPPWSPSYASGAVPCGFAYLYLSEADDTWTVTPVVYTPYVRFRITWTGGSTAQSWLGEETPITNSEDWAGARMAGMLIYRTAT